MDFSFTDEQQILLDSTRRLLTDKYSVQQRRQIVSSPEGYSRSIWQQFSELGLLGLNIPAEDGGLDGGAISTLLVCMAMGEALVTEPYLSSAVVATRAIAKLGSSVQRSEWLPRLNSGVVIAALAHDQANNARTQAMLQDTLAARWGDAWRLVGRKAIVYHAPLADLLLISAQLDKASGAGTGLFAVPRGAPGLKLEAFTTVDGQQAADVVLEMLRPGRPCAPRRRRVVNVAIGVGLRHRRLVRGGNRRARQAILNDCGVWPHTRAIRPADRTVSGSPAPYG